MAKKEQKKDQDDDLMTAQAVAQFLGISRQRVGQLRAEGKLKATQVGIWLYRKGDVVKAKNTLHFNSKRDAEEECEELS